LVYDLTVEREHCYLANGLLVSNSDSFRYLSLSWKRAPTLKPRLSVPSIRSNWTIPPPVEPRRREIRL
jgi:hypothetical protein